MTWSSGMKKEQKVFLGDGQAKNKASKRLDDSFFVMQDVNHQLFTESVEEEILLSMKEKKGKTILLIIHDIELILFLL